MVLFTAKDATVDQKCSIARELLDEFKNIPTYYLRAISAPLVRQTTLNTEPNLTNIYISSIILLELA